MASLDTDGELPLIETYPVADEFAEGIARIDNLGCCFRLVLFSTQTEPNGDRYRAVVRKIVVPKDAQPAIREKINAFFADRLREKA
jgi:hypothetical protein